VLNKKIKNNIREKLNGIRDKLKKKIMNIEKDVEK
jgi:hypothetical protein